MNQVLSQVMNQVSNQVMKQVLNGSAIKVGIDFTEANITPEVLTAVIAAVTTRPSVFYNHPFADCDLF